MNALIHVGLLSEVCRVTADRGILRMGAGVGGSVFIEEESFVDGVQFLEEGNSALSSVFLFFFFYW